MAGPLSRRCAASYVLRKVKCCHPNPTMNLRVTTWNQTTNGRLGRICNDGHTEPRTTRTMRFRSDLR